MTREKLFAFIKSKGGNKCVIRFSGGNDEGGCHDIVIQKDDTVICQLHEDYWPEDSGREQTPENALVRGLCRPVYDKYYTFAGEYSVTGEVIWDTTTKTVKMKGCEEVLDYENFEENC